MSASVKPRLAGRQPSVRGRGAPGEDRARGMRRRASRDAGGSRMTAVTRDTTEHADRGIGLRPATAGDAGQIAALHADSWRRHYRGAYSDAFLDGDVLTDRLRV